MEIRQERPEDTLTIANLNDIAFEGSKEESAIIDRLRTDGNLLLSLVAVDSGNVVGHVAFSPMFLDGTNKRLVGLAPMAVTPAMQKTGVGSALVSRAIEILRDQGAEAIFVLGHPKYYPKFGFAPAKSRFGIQSTYEVPDEAFMVLELKPGSLNGLSGTVSYSPAFLQGV